MVLFLVLKIKTEPGTAPKNVQVRPLSSTTMLIQWEEPDTPNGQVIVSVLSLFVHYCKGYRNNIDPDVMFNLVHSICRVTKCFTRPIRV